MSKQNNLTDFLTDVADAIRSKKGTTDLINPQNFSAEILALSGGLEVIEMTETTATIEPNKVYVWGMVESLDITLGASTGEDDFFAFRFRCSKPTMTVVTVNGATWAADTELDESGNPILDLGSYYQCEIKGGTSALYARLAHYIPFEDANVEAVLLANGVGDGLGVTYKDAEKVSSISTWFKDNANISAFDEFAEFTGIKTLVKYTFYGCSNLQRVKLPSSITSFSGEGVFQNCRSLIKLEGLANIQLTTLSNNTFKNCVSLREIALPASLRTIGESTFDSCRALSQLYGYERTQVTTIYFATFRYCSSLTQISLPATLTLIKSNAFDSCTKLAKVEGLERTQVTTIENAAFQDCASLTEIALPETLTSIWGSAFQYCTSLAKIELPASLRGIGARAFYNCSRLKYINMKATIPPNLASTDAIPSTIGAIYVPDESVAAYQAATNWSSFASKIKGISEMPSE